MSCNNCATCTCKETRAPFEVAMGKANELIHYLSEHEDHPQFESLLYPRRVAVADHYMGVQIDPMTGPRIVIWETDTPDVEPVMYISGTAMGLTNPDAPPPLTTSGKLVELVTQFDSLIHTSFFRG